MNNGRVGSCSKSNSKDNNHYFKAKEAWLCSNVGTSYRLIHQGTNRRIRDPYVRWCERRTPSVYLAEPSTQFSAGFISCCLVFSVGKTILFAKFWCGGWWCDLAMCMALCVGYLINLICKFRLKNNTSFLPLFFIIQKWKYRFLLLRCLHQSIFVREQLHRLDRLFSIECLAIFLSTFLLLLRAFFLVRYIFSLYQRKFPVLQNHQEYCPMSLQENQ